MERVDPVLTSRARSMRKTPSLGDAKLWDLLRGRKLGVRFTRQLPVGNFILDFACRSARLAIEVDGRGHDGRIAADRQRTAWLEAQGWRVLRFSAADAVARPHELVDVVAAVLDGRIDARCAMRWHPAQPD